MFEIHSSLFILILGLLIHTTNAIAPVIETHSKMHNSDIKGINGYDFDRYYNTPTPIVILHGITSDKSQLVPVVEWLISRLPNKVYNIEIGNGWRNSLFKTMDWQINELCLAIYAIPELEDGFHFIGMSQGGLLARGYVQRCNRYPVRNLITWVSPQAGIYGFNQVYFDWKKVYMPETQSRWSFAGYWKDPYQYDAYITNSSFLPYLNNESPNHAEYGYYGFHFYQNRERIESLDNFVMIWSAADDVISPPQSGKFEFYNIVCGTRETPGCQELITKKALQVQDFFKSPQYVDNLLGLRTLFQNGKLHMLETNCTHSGHKSSECFPQLEELTFPFLT